jgi:HAD superfamily hydrolase (TIGR01509 family)
MNISVMALVSCGGGTRGIMHFAAVGAVCAHALPCCCPLLPAAAASSRELPVCARTTVFQHDPPTTHTLTGANALGKPTDHHRGAISIIAASSGNNGTTAASTPATPKPLPDLSKLRAVLFDIDGTLCNSDPLHFAAFREALIAAGFNGGAPIDEPFFRSRISGRHNPEIAADLFPDWPEADRVEFYEAKEARFRDLARTTLQRMPGLTEWLAWLQARGVKVAAVTNAPRANTELMLRSLQLDATFEAVVLGEECARAKPHPDPYLDAMAALGVDAASSLVIEDSPSGLTAAVAAGVPAVGITTGQPRQVLEAAGACLLIDDFFALLAVAERRASAAAAAAGGDGDGEGVASAAAPVAQQVKSS